MKSKVKIGSLLLAVVMSLSLVACGSKDKNKNPYDNGKMRADMPANDFVKEMGFGINLGNTMESYWEGKGNKTSGSARIGENKTLNYETCWGAIETTQEAIDGMKNAGFNTVRVPVYWGNMMEDDGKFTINEEWIKRVKEIVDYCRKIDLYVVINVHHYDEFLIRNHPKEKVLEATEHIWTQIANYFKDYSDYLIFEGFNESLGNKREVDNLSEDEIYDDVNELNKTFVDTVRKTGGNNKNRLLIVSGYWTNIDLTTNDRFIVPEDSAKNKIMVSVHYIDNIPYWSNKIGGDYWLEYSKEQCELLKKAFTDKGIPVFVGECTSIYTNDRIASNATIKTSSECLDTVMSMAVEYGFVPVLWDVNDNFYSRTEYKIKSESDQAIVTKIAEMIKNK